MEQGPGETPKPVFVAAPPASGRSFPAMGMIMVLLGGMVLGTTCSTCAMQDAGSGPFGDDGPKVGVVEVTGAIMASRDTVEALADFAKDDDIEAVILRIDSPGGSVGPSQEIYEAVRRTAAEKPVVASMGAVAASGGFWIALGADEVFANAGTLTGSIGVIVQTPDLSSIAEMLKFKMRTYKSGHHKDMGSPYRPSTEGDDRIFQALIDDIYMQFVELTATRRGLPMASVRPLADGRIFTGREAQARGLVDGLGGLETAARRAMALVKETETSTNTLSETAPVLVYPPEDVPPFLQLLGAKISESVATGLAEGLERSVQGASANQVQVR